MYFATEKTEFYFIRGRWSYNLETTQNKTKEKTAEYSFDRVLYKVYHWWTFSIKILLAANKCFCKCPKKAYLITCEKM